MGYDRGQQRGIRMSDYEMIGGEAAVAAAVDDFYSKLTSDPETAEFFQDTDVVELKIRQRMFLTAALGGPDAYEGRDMRAAHAHLHVTEEHFDLFLDHLAGSLADLGFDAARIAEVRRSLEPLRLEIVSAPPTGSEDWI